MALQAQLGMVLRQLAPLQQQLPQQLALPPRHEMQPGALTALRLRLLQHFRHWE